MRRRPHPGRSSERRPESLDRFRDGVAELLQDDVVVGHLATRVEDFWGLAGHQERVWLLVTWSDGRQERIEEDYPPWTIVDEIREGTLRWTIDGQESHLEVRWLQGDDARAAWRLHGIHHPVGHYL